MIELIRTTKTSTSTIGELLIDKKFICFILEDAVREVKLPGRTAIPAGTYDLSFTYSNRFKRMMILIEGVPNFTGIRFHSGNRVTDTEGCLLTGMDTGTDVVYSSQIAYELLWDAMTKKLIDKDRMQITIS